MNIIEKLKNDLKKVRSEESGIGHMFFKQKKVCKTKVGEEEKYDYYKVL